MDRIEQHILDSGMTADSELHRIVCHFLLLVALVMEPDFVQYVLLRTHNREAMRYYVNEVLRISLADLITGVITNSSNQERSMFDLATFVRNGRHYYSLYCIPQQVPSIV